MSRLTPAWFLFLFAPVTAEFLSGSSPITNPILVLINLLLYGPGVLLIRELRVRWGKGWLAVFILSFAYTVVEEGLMLNTLFDPTKNTAGRSHGVNWVWTVGMLVVHSLISIFLPILTAEAVYSRRARESWISSKAFVLMLLALAANVVGFGRLIAPNDRPPFLDYAIELGFVAACLLVAKFLPGPRRLEASTGDGSEEGRPATGSPRRLFFVSLFGTILLFVVSFAAPAMNMSAWIMVAAMVGVYLGFLAVLARFRTFDPRLPALSKLAAAGGIITFWLMVSPMAAFGKGNPSPLIAAVPMVWFLLSARRRLLRETLEGTEVREALAGGVG